MLDQSILVAKVCLEAAEDADVVVFREPGVVVLEAVERKSRLQRVQVVSRVLGVIVDLGNWCWLCGRKEIRESRVQREAYLIYHVPLLVYDSAIPWIACGSGNSE